jgi:signal transduction histidine kinase
MQLNTLVEESLLLIRDQKLFGNIKIVKELAEVMMMVYVDKDQISQVIINLVMNACAAMDGKGTLTLRTTRNKRQKTAYLEVIDTGCGIPKENLSRIFDPFFTTKELGKGTGLGLSTAYGIMQENGGSISVKKTGPTGTSFLIALPLYLPSEEAGSV